MDHAAKLWAGQQFRHAMSAPESAAPAPRSLAKMRDGKAALLRKSFRKGALFGTFAPSGQTEARQHRAHGKEVHRLRDENGVLAAQVEQLTEAMNARDDRVLRMRETMDAQEHLYFQELRLAEAERDAADGELEHGRTMASAELGRMHERARVCEGAAEMLVHAHAERFKYEHKLHQEQLGRSEDVATMHEELIKLRDRLDREMRAGLEAFRETYKEEAYRQISEEGRAAIHDRYLLEAYAAREKGVAASWHDRYERLRAHADGERVELELQRSAQSIHMRKIVGLRRQIEALRHQLREADDLRLQLDAHSQAALTLKTQLAASHAERAKAERARARALDDAHRTRQLLSRERAAAAVGRRRFAAASPSKRPQTIVALAAVETASLTGSATVAEGHGNLEAIWRSVPQLDTPCAMALAAPPAPPAPPGAVEHPAIAAPASSAPFSAATAPTAAAAVAPTAAALPPSDTLVPPPTPESASVHGEATTASAAAPSHGPRRSPSPVDSPVSAPTATVIRLPSTRPAAASALSPPALSTVSSSQQPTQPTAPPTTAPPSTQPSHLHVPRRSNSSPPRQSPVLRIAISAPSLPFTPNACTRPSSAFACRQSRQHGGPAANGTASASMLVPPRRADRARGSAGQPPTEMPARARGGGWRDRSRPNSAAGLLTRERRGAPFPASAVKGGSGVEIMHREGSAVWLRMA